MEVKFGKISIGYEIIFIELWTKYSNCRTSVELSASTGSKIGLRGHRLGYWLGWLGT